VLGGFIKGIHLQEDTEVAPISLVLPDGQDIQVDPLRYSLSLQGLQSVEEVEPDGLVLPPPQGVQFDAPAALYVPAKHDVQDVPLVPYVPARHGLHAPLSSL
jgi:hypothetical protein